MSFPAFNHKLQANQELSPSIGFLWHRCLPLEVTGVDPRAIHSVPCCLHSPRHAEKLSLVWDLQTMLWNSPGKGLYFFYIWIHIDIFLVLYIYTYMYMAHSTAAAWMLYIYIYITFSYIIEFINILITLIVLLFYFCTNISILCVLLYITK